VIKNKKNTIKEETYLDVTKQFSSKEKKILRILHKEYSCIESLWEYYDIWKVATELIETYGIGYQMAYNISDTYYYNRNDIFKELEATKKTVFKGFIFFRYMERIFNKIYNITTENDSPQIMDDLIINMQGDENFTDKRTVSLWNREDRIMFYIPFNLNPISVLSSVYWEYERHRKLLVTIKYYYLDKYNTPIEFQSWNTPKDPEEYNNNFLIKITYEVSPFVEGETNLGEIGDIILPYPEEVTENSIEKMASIIMDKSLKLTKEFKYPIDEKYTIKVPTDQTE